MQTSACATQATASPACKTAYRNMGCHTQTPAPHTPGYPHVQLAVLASHMCTSSRNPPAASCSNQAPGSTMKPLPAAWRLCMHQRADGACQVRSGHMPWPPGGWQQCTQVPKSRTGEPLSLPRGPGAGSHCPAWPAGSSSPAPRRCVATLRSSAAGGRASPPARTAGQHEAQTSGRRGKYQQLSAQHSRRVAAQAACRWRCRFALLHGRLQGGASR